ncbi:MAG TPA: ribose-5-phosphate isomerase RpiA [Anaerolineae bacterium]
MSTQSGGYDEATRYKIQAAQAAVAFVNSGMRLGLGTGSTAIWATRRIAELLHDGTLKGIQGFATSRATFDEASRLGIPMLPDELDGELDVTIDGADEVDPQLDVIKGGGGALLREKIVAQVSRRYIITVDESKLSQRLGTHFNLPVEVITFGWHSQRQYIESLGGQTQVRLLPDGTPYRTDSGNMILDCHFGPISDAVSLAAALSRRAGIVEHGLFLGMSTDVIVAGPSGLKHLRRF